MHPPPASAVEQIGDYRPVEQTGDASLPHGAHDLADSGIMRGLRQQGGAGDDLAAGIALAVAERPPGGGQLVARGKPGRGRRVSAWYSPEWLTTRPATRINRAPTHSVPFQASRVENILQLSGKARL